MKVIFSAFSVIAEDGVDIVNDGESELKSSVPIVKIGVILACESAVSSFYVGMISVGGEAEQEVKVVVVRPEVLIIEPVMHSYMSGLAKQPIFSSNASVLG